MYKVARQMYAVKSEAIIRVKYRGEKELLPIDV